MAQMILRQHNWSCHNGPHCCAIIHKNSNHRTVSGRRAKRALKRRDRQNALKGES